MPEPQELTEPEASPLLEALTIAYRQGSEITVTAGGLLDALRSPDRQISAIATTHILAFGAKLTEIFVKDSRFPGDRFLMTNGENSDRKIYPNCIGQLLVQRALETGSPKEAIQWVQKVLGTTVVSGTRIHALWGVSVARPFELTKDVKIVPFRDVPDSEHKRQIARSPSMNMSLFNLRSDWRPTAALIMTRRIKPFIYDAGSESRHSKQAIKELSDSMEALRDITLVLTVIGPRPAMSVGNWLTYDDADVQRAIEMMGLGWSSQWQEINPYGFGDYPELDLTEAQKIVCAYFALPIPTRDIIRVALQRLNQAIRRSHPGDRAVELSIALEALLGNGNSEMTHKIKVRSVRLIGGSNEVRRRNATIIDKTYSIRSKLVHTGSVAGAKAETICGVSMSVSDIVSLAIVLCADVTKKIILRGKIPDWSSFDIEEHK